MLTLTEAAKATGKHKSTVLRALQADKIPSEKDVHGNYQIDPENLFAVYPQQSTVAQPERTDSNAQPDPPERTEAPLHTDALPMHNDAHQNAIADLEAARVTDLQATIAELNRRLDEAAETEAKHLQLLAMKEKSAQLTHETTDDRLAEIRAERDAWRVQAQAVLLDQGAAQGNKKRWWSW